MRICFIGFGLTGATTLSYDWCFNAGPFDICLCSNGSTLGFDSLGFSFFSAIYFYWAEAGGFIFY